MLKMRNTLIVSSLVSPRCPPAVDLWQTFEVDSLEHLEALEVVTARLERRLNLCRASVMMVTCFDAATRRRHKKRRRKAPEQRALKGI